MVQARTRTMPHTFGIRACFRNFRVRTFHIPPLPPIQLHEKARMVSLQALKVVGTVLQDIEEKRVGRTATNMLGVEIKPPVTMMK